MLHDGFCLEGLINLVARSQGARTVAGISVQFIHSLQTCSHLWKYCPLFGSMFQKYTDIG